MTAPRSLTLPLAVAAILASFPGPLEAQRVTVSRPWTPIRDTWMAVIVPRKGAELPPAVARRVNHGRLFERVIGFRADSLLINAPPDSLNWSDRADAAFQAGVHPRILTIPAAAIDRVGVRGWSEQAARRETGSECGTYLGFVGAALGGGAGAIAGKKQAAIGLGVGALGAYVYGYRRCSKHPYHDYGYVWENLKVGIAPGPACDTTCGP